MAQIDRLVAVMVSSGGGSLALEEGEPARVDVRGDSRDVTRNPLTGQQIATLVREVAPPESLRLIDGGSPASFALRSNGEAFAARASVEDGRWSVRISNPALPIPVLHGDAYRPPALVSEAIALVDPGVRPLRREDGAGGSAQRRIDELLSIAIEERASDLHLRTGEPPILRRDGEVVRLDQPSLDAEQISALVWAMMPAKSRTEFEEVSDTDFAYEMPGRGRFRVNVLADRNGPGAVFRRIPPHVVTASELDLPPEVQRLAQLTRGLVLVTGPTGSGKSTTLCALVDLVNETRSDHLVTIEDPIEFVHPSKRCIVTQREVGVHTRSFKAALRAALREDPDVVLIGEMRDLETVSIALETAETGHLVFASLHTTTAASTIDRIIDQFPADQQEQIRVMLADSLSAVISQTLCKRIGGGRVAAREVLFNTPSVANLIRERKTFQVSSIMQTSKRLGMATLTDALVDLIESGAILPEEAYNRAVDKASLVNAMKNKGYDLGPDTVRPSGSQPRQSTARAVG